MKHLSTIFCSLLLATLISSAVVAQDYVNVTFRYTPSASAVRAFVPGEFNGWGPNSSGVIANNAVSLMEEDVITGFWYKVIRLEVGGGTSTNNGTTGYAYKFHEHLNTAGSNWTWLSDPLNDITIGDNSDSFIEAKNALIFQMQPDNGSVHELNSPEFWANVAVIEGDTLDLAASQVYINDTAISSFEGYYNEALQLLNVPSAGEVGGVLVNGSNEFKIKAVTKSGITNVDSTQFSFIGESQTAYESRPDGLRDGITYSADGSVYFSLFAPYKSKVYAIGDFNDWTVDPSYVFKKDSLSADSVWYWYHLTGLSTAQEYAFQYLVDNELRIADPYSELVLDESNDQYISEAVFPNLLEYPSGKTNGLVSVLQPGKEAYEWEANDYVRPENDDLVIYELLLRDFLADHSYTTLIDTLDYLDSLNITAIELMPVNEFDGNESWGYNPSLHMALDKYYGSPTEFKRFVDEAHKRGIAVILDVVLNHSFGQNPIVRLWNEGEYGNPTSQNPYFNVAAKHPYNVGYDMNHESSATKYYSKRVMEYWIEEYNIDGYRFDLSKGFTQTNNPNDVGAWGNYDASRVAIWKEYYDYIRTIDETAYVILEHFADNSEDAALANYGMLVWGNANHQYSEATMGYHDSGKSNFVGVQADGRSGFSFRHLVGYMESHDEQWLMFKNRSFGNSSGTYDITNLGTALDRMELAGAFFLPLPGPKMIWQFGELGYGYGNAGEQCLNDSDDCPSSAPGRTANKPIRWDYNSDPDRKDLYSTWADLIALRRASDAFTRPTETFYAFSDAVKYYRLKHSDSDVVAIGNFGVTSTTQTVDFTQDGTWFDYFGETSINVSSQQYEITLEPGEFKIFTTKQFKFVTANEVDENESPTTFALEQNYPNPFNPSTQISFQLPVSSMVTLDIFDLTGRKVATLLNGQHTAGSHQVTFNAANLSSGVYVYRLQAGTQLLTKKMMLLK